MVDVYNVAETNPAFRVDILDISNPMAIYVDQIINLLHGEAGSTMGALDMPVDLEHYVYETGVNEVELRNRIVGALNSYVPLYKVFDTNVEVKFAKGNVRDICIIDIIINSQKSLKFTIH